ncbi:MAG TPA: 23S rRNA (guanosine(2251)-2'-O)-methyltransferase RlmB [Stellaceae bacterium]|nr:23S rRNA (guanosine(2251)-2'-O)-methyltransferase RlmB [Stellaceae bacterium]
MTAARPPRRTRGQFRRPPPLPAGLAAGGRWLYGRHAVAAALANPARRWRRLAVLAGQEREAKALVAAARARRHGEGEAVNVVEPRDLARILPREAVHQGLALEVEPLEEPSLDAVLEGAGPAAIVIVLDRVADPHNVGAVLRSAAAFGALAVLVPVHGAPPAAGALAKAASGALESVPLVGVVNLARALDRLKEDGFWVCGLAEGAREAFSAVEFGARVALVLGAEGEGMRRLVRERCDRLARLPTRADFASLNVSNAAAVALYEITRQRG